MKKNQIKCKWNRKLRRIAKNYVVKTNELKKLIMSIDFWQRSRCRKIIQSRTRYHTLLQESFSREYYRNIDDALHVYETI